ncbi:uncharacterized protein YjiS (DUF1127 family) [Rhizobium sp. BIGb0125]|jgi:uncharacterized protein YjiS (DUF1127 family)|uniref:DUF1127 domain-containing protein n=1 Tax=Rhizobium sp. BIGb0125 TaxID=2940618 RepID=UPI00386E0058|nr:uncharacterized protein YjiS (DUF1127 family) [Rhizobium sp. BIGb0125]
MNTNSRHEALYGRRSIWSHRAKRLTQTLTAPLSWWNFQRKIRRQIEQLRLLDDHILRDLGMSRQEISCLGLPLEDVGKVRRVDHPWLVERQNRARRSFSEDDFSGVGHETGLVGSVRTNERAGSHSDQHLDPAHVSRPSLCFRFFSLFGPAACLVYPVSVSARDADERGGENSSISRRQGRE